MLANVYRITRLYLMSTASIDKQNRGEVVSAAERQICAALKNLRFGSIEIVVHEGKVVQIHRLEKLRLETDH